MNRTPSRRVGSGGGLRWSDQDLPGPALSVVVPMFDEEENVEPLVAAVRKALGDAADWELIIVDDGSSDATVIRAERLAAADPRVRLLSLTRNFGQTAAMQAGFDHARGSVIVSMDGDLQNDPADIRRLVGKLREGYDLVAGYREKRQDKLITRRVPSWVANRIVRCITGVPIRDSGCSLKAYRSDLLQRVQLYSDMHRFIPAIAAATVGARITEVPVRHHPRRHGQSKYGLGRVAKVVADLLTIEMIRSFRERPLALFGGAALASGMLGVLSTLLALAVHVAGRAVEANAFVVPGVALLWFGLGFYLVMLGLVAEAIVGRHARVAGRQHPIVEEVSWTTW